ncbi:LuxR C-terminal-related transcriptional regulator [Azospirillum sp. CT11-132]|uniref:LuxR C-terminal-related transcriptional regulator n=1 Tax=Azospirillum sp. CT11-132 TaxID=3396317 RepID=UPI0039A52AE6
MTFIAAPAGFGKSALLRELCRRASREGRPTVWCDYETGEGELPTDWRPTAFADMASLQRKAQAVGVRSRKPAWIFVDNAHLADQSSLSMRLRSLTAGTMGGVRYFFAARSLPDLNWVELELSRRARVLRTEDMALTWEEAHDFLHLHAQRRLETEVVQQIHGTTEGWPIALQLYGMAAGAVTEWSQVQEGDLRIEEALERYIDAAVLGRLSPRMVSFLAVLARFNRFSRDMCAAVMPDTDAPALLDQAVRKNLLVVPAVGKGRWFRLHAMVASHLRNHPVASWCDPDGDLLDRAAAWCAANGAVEDAVDYALLAGRPEMAQRLLLENACALIRERGMLPQMLGWVGALERSGIDIAPMLHLWKIWSLVFLMRLDHARTEFDRLTAALPDLPVQEAEALRPHLEQVRGSIELRRDRLTDVVDLTGRWLECWDHGDPFLVAAVLGARSIARFNRHEEVACRRTLETAWRAARSSASEYAQAWLTVLEGMFECASGRTVLATRIVEQGLSQARTTMGASTPVVSTLSLVAARLRCEAGDFAEARRHLSKGLAHFHDHGLTDTAVIGLEAAAALTEYEQGGQAALALLRRFLAKGRRYTLRYDLEAHRISVLLLLRLGDVRGAREEFTANFVDRAASVMDATWDEEMRQLYRWQIDFLEAAFALAEQRFGAVLDLCAGLLPYAEAHGRTRRMVELLLLKAAAQAGEGQTSVAMRSFSRAIWLAAENALAQTVFELNWAVRPLLTANGLGTADRTVVGFLDGLRRRLNLAATVPEDEAPVDTLTSRELELLRALDSGLTNQDIAECFSLSIATVKWHLQNVYSKLCVANRSGALAKARCFGLL